MRIIAGRHKGRKLFSQQRAGLRPTSSRVKEALFNILGQGIEGADFLDIFAGCGQIGIEALSRGADTVDFIEKDGSSCHLIEKNLRLLDETGGVYHASFEKALPLLSKSAKTFSYIFLDPGYRSNDLKSCLRLLTLSSIINKDTIIIAEHDSKHQPEDECGCLVRYRQAVYGDTALTFYRKPLT